MPNPTFGWLKDKYDPRDYIHPTMKLAAIPAKVILPNVPPVRNQGAQGACVGFGIGANLTSKRTALQPQAEWDSPQWVYNGARFIEGTLNQDIGCYPKDALDWIFQSGCLLEQFWPYDPNRFDPSAPSSTRMAKATKYKDFAYYRVVDGLDGLCSALAAGNMVSIGSPWFDKWMQIDSTGRLPEVAESDKVVGGHETLLRGYDQANAVFYGMNSWGTEWGSNGFYEMPFSAIEVFKKLWGFDAHYITFTPDNPPPPPDPVKPGCFPFARLMQLVRPQIAGAL